MALTGAQVKQLRSMAHHLNPAIIIGKSDVNEGTVEQTVAYLEKHELVKCSVLDGSSLSAREAAEADGKDAPETDPHFYMTKAHLFHALQVEKSKR